MKSKEKKVPGWAIWFVGLPGAGKSTYAQAVHKALQKTGENVQYLRMDECRKSYFAKPKYTSSERTKAYKLFVEEAAQIVKKGTNVIMDGTAPKLFMREYARNFIERFAEIFVSCPLEIAMYREANRPKGLVMADLYQKALKRKETGIYTEGLGEVVGVDIPFEENPTAECVIESDRMSVNEGRSQTLAFLKNWQAIRIPNRN